MPYRSYFVAACRAQRHSSTCKFLVYLILHCNNAKDIVNNTQGFPAKKSTQAYLVLQSNAMSNTHKPYSSCWITL